MPLPDPFGPDDAADELALRPPQVLTIGHSNHRPDLFLALLRQNGVCTLVDVRSAPCSWYSPHFNRSSLEALLDEEGIRYLWAGDSLGGRPDDPTCYRDGVVRKGDVDYAALAQRAWYLDGVGELLATAMGSVTAIMCSEEDPQRCHRHHLIAATLRDRGVEVLHIRRDGALETIEPDEAAPPAAARPQLALIGIDG